MQPAQNFLGCLIPTYTDKGLTSNQSRKIAEACQSDAKFVANGRKIHVYVGSANALKVEAARKAVQIWANFHFRQSEVIVKGFEVKSEISEQPHGYELTSLGAANRIKNMIPLVAKELDKRFLTIFVSMENGLISEEVHNIPNFHLFMNAAKTRAWIDRCFVAVQIATESHQWFGEALSVGVPTPISCVEKAEAANWDKTAGFFIQEQFGFPAKDWHGDLAGKSRQPIMEEAILSAFGLQK